MRVQVWMLVHKVVRFQSQWILKMKRNTVHLYCSPLKQVSFNWQTQKIGLTHWYRKTCMYEHTHNAYTVWLNVWMETHIQEKHLLVYDSVLILNKINKKYQLNKGINDDDASDMQCTNLHFWAKVLTTKSQYCTVHHFVTEISGSKTKSHK